MKLNSNQCHELITPVIDSLALTGVVARELNYLRRDQLKCRLPAKTHLPAKNVPTDSQWLFGNDRNKRISLLNKNVFG